MWDARGPGTMRDNHRRAINDANKDGKEHDARRRLSAPQ